MLLGFLLISALLLLAGAVAAHLIAARLARALTSLRISGEVLRATRPSATRDPAVLEATTQYMRGALGGSARRWRYE